MIPLLDTLMLLSTIPVWLWLLDGYKKRKLGHGVFYILGFFAFLLIGFFAIRTLPLLALLFLPTVAILFIVVVSRVLR